MKTKSDEMKRKKRKEKAEIEEWRGAEKGFVLYITVLKEKFKGSVLKMGCFSFLVLIII